MSLEKALSPNRIFLLCTPGSELHEPAFVDLLGSYAQAMWSWSRAENKLFILFLLAFGVKNKTTNEALRETFFSVISPQGRIDMLHAAATKAWRRTKAWKPWVSLYAQFKQELSVRGRFAHLIGAAYYPTVLKGKAHALLIEPTWHPQSPISYGQAKNRGFDAVQLSEYARQWEFLGNRLGTFVALIGAIGQPRPSDEL